MPTKTDGSSGVKHLLWTGSGIMTCVVFTMGAFAWHKEVPHKGAMEKTDHYRDIGIVTEAIRQSKAELKGDIQLLSEDVKELLRRK